MKISSILATLSGKKTYGTGIISILSVALAYATGEATLIDSLQIIVPAILAMTMRSAIKTGTATPTV